MLARVISIGYGYLMPTDTKREPQNVNVIFTPEILDEVEEHAERMRKGAPAMGVTRSDAVRDLVLRGARDAKRVRR